MMKFIFYVFTTPCLVSYFHRYGMEYLQHQGWEITVLDVSAIVHPEAYAEVSTGLIDNVSLKRFSYKKEYKQFVKSIKEPVMFIFTEDFNLPTRFLYTSLRKEHHYGYMSRQDTNVEYYAENRVEAYKKYLSNLSFKRICRSLYVRIPRKLLFLKTADFHILGGEKNRELYIRLALTDRHTKIVHFHSLDYEAFLEARNSAKRLVDDKYWVFIDEYLPYHPDAKNPELIKEFKIEPLLYYKELREFFHFIEDTLNVRVIIASHPRGDYEKHPEAYEGFTVFRFLTNELIKNAEVVLSHFSTCEGFAALFKKPIIHLMTSGIFNHDRYRNTLYYFSSKLDSPILETRDHGYRHIDIRKLCVVDESRYNEEIRLYYKANYSGISQDYDSMYPKLNQLINDCLFVTTQVSQAVF